MNRFSDFKQLTVDERVIATSITFTFVFYWFGALYLVAPVLGWGLMGWLVIRWTVGETFSSGNLKWLVILWLAAAILLELCLIMGHLDFDLGLVKIIKSTIGWAKGWALLSIFIVLGYCLPIRWQVVCRAACVVGLVAIVVTPFLVLAYSLSLPSQLYVSPLKVLGGSGPEFFTVTLYDIDPVSGAPRWRFFAPWAPAVGFVANIYFMCAWFEQDRAWRIWGMLGNGLMIVMSASRMGMLVVLFVPFVTFLIGRIQQPRILFTLIMGSLVCVFFAEPILNSVTDLVGTVKSARADSTQVRSALANIALYRWQSEAFWFGHGVVETGTHLVKFMPIGSHHNWYGLLFVKGLVGFLAFGIPFAITLLILAIKAQFCDDARLAFSMMLILSCFSMSENIEALAYMTWPAWLLVGCGLRGKNSVLLEWLMSSPIVRYSTSIQTK